ncbi:hypothetical protein ACP70R_004573 [Stipagrostis hirtigluma subsp. patula]
MQLRFRPLAAGAVGGGRGFHAARLRPVRESKGRPCRNVASFSSPSGKEGEGAAGGETPDEARRRLAELDALLEGLTEPKLRPPAPPPPPDPYLDRDFMTGRGSSEELPEFSPTYVAFSTLALVILTIFTNVMFNVYIKPSVDGVDQPVRVQRVPLVNPADGQTQ